MTEMSTFRKLFVLALCLSLESCHVGRYFYWNLANISDYKKFPAECIAASADHFSFATTDQNLVPDLPASYVSSDKVKDLPSFLQKNHTVAFIIIRNDTILYEEYFRGYDRTSLIASFSVAKVFVSALTGIAISDGFIKSTSQPVTDFLPELLASDPRFGQITLEHLLNMRSGIDFNEGYASPFADMAKFYYGKNLRRYIRKLKIEQLPDKEYNYISANTQLLGMAVERASGQTLAELLETKIWKPLGMESDATWNTDSRKHRQIKAFCCINACALDFARFGRLYLNNGNWNGHQIVSVDWVKRSMSIINDSRDSEDYPYTYQWRVKEDGAIFAKGILGQYIYVFPEKNVIIVRMGTKNSNITWVDFFEQLCRQL